MERVESEYCCVTSATTFTNAAFKSMRAGQSGQSMLMGAAPPSPAPYGSKTYVDACSRLAFSRALRAAFCRRFAAA